MNTNSKVLKPGATLFASAVLFITGCNQQPVASAAGVGAASGGAYEVILETRPENPKMYPGRGKAFYDLCVAAAQVQHLPVKPFVAFPADYVMVRQTYVSDGKNFLEKKESFDLDIDKLLPESGCATQITPSINIKVWRDGKFQSQDIKNNEAPETSPPEQQLSAGRQSTASTFGYSQRQVMQGVPLRCLPSGDPIIQSGTLLAGCVFDGPGDSTLADAEGKAIMLHVRMPSIESDPRFASNLVTIPKSVVTGKAIPSIRFALQGASQ